MTFKYKDGEEYICVLCNKPKHTHGPRPDKLCDPCWELKTRVMSHPELAKRVLASMEDK